LKRRKLLTGLVTLRLDEATIARIDALRPLLSTRVRDATRAEALRLIIRAGLDCVEHDFEDAIRARRSPSPTR
jgi:hypothetical protein